jgi:GTP:adenosylcobinamide-phosphate guanylyltransferase
MSVSVLLLAGSRGGPDPLCDLHGVASKALIPICGVQMIDYVLEALGRSTIGAAPIWISGLPIDAIGKNAKPSLAGTVSNLRQAPAGDGPASGVMRAADAGLSPPFLITTCDHPLLNSDILDSFMEKARGNEADIAVGLASRETIEAAHPEVRRTYLKFSDGQYSGCNLFYVRTKMGLEVVKFWQSVERDRKKPLRLARRFGVFALLRMVLWPMGIDAAFAYASKKMGVRVTSVRLPFADASVDVDKVSDLELVTRLLETRQKK